MSVEREQRILELLDEAVELSGREREAFLDESCAEDDPLRQELEALLDTEIGDGLLSEPAFSVHADDEGIGRQIGGYKLVRLLDRGGMGAVYLAEREDFEQRVALKLIRRGLDADEVLVRRFENERQILARLEHRHIARLLDGGATGDRLPYFVMEYVEGVAIDRYCRDHKQTVGERLELFRKVCSAVQFAHQNLVIHRDLKPGNILITEAGEPKLLDFGIAKLLDQGLAAQTLTTAGQGPMTPRYASPEQIRLESVTTASDVYSLGVLLYELLTGLDPYGVDSRRSDEVARAICEREPDRPSTAVRRRATEAESDETRKLRRRLSGDLDSIVLKAMRKEPEERYGTAEQLSEDVHRHLTGLPVGAQTGSFSYRASKFVRRHRLGMAVTAAFMLLTVGFSIVSTVLWRQAVNERERTTRLSQFLQDLFRASDPDQATNSDQTALELLERGKHIFEESLKEDPETLIAVAGTMGEIFRKRGAYDASKELMEILLRFAQERYEGDHPEVAKRLANLAVLLNDHQDYEEAERLFRQALAMRLRQDQRPPELVRVKGNLATNLMLQGKYKPAEKLYLEVLATRQEVASGPDDKDVATSRRNLAALYYAKGESQNAEPLLDEALEARRNVFGSEHTLVASVLDLLGSVLAAQGRIEEAEQKYEKAYAIRSQRLPKDHTDIAKTEKNLAALLARRDPVRAQQLIDQALLTLDPDGREAAEALSVLGDILLGLGKVDEAEQHLIEGYKRLEQLRGSHDFRTRMALNRILDLDKTLGTLERFDRYRSVAESLSESASQTQRDE